MAAPSDAVTRTAARTVLVTGASRGIGAAIARRFAAAGDRIIVHYGSDVAAAEAVCAALPPSALGPHACVRADLSLPGASGRLISEALALCPTPGGIDVLVCNHGVCEETPFESTTSEAWAASFDRHAHQSARACRACVCLCKVRQDDAML